MLFREAEGVNTVQGEALILQRLEGLHLGPNGIFIIPISKGKEHVGEISIVECYREAAAAVALH